MLANRNSALPLVLMRLKNIKDAVTLIEAYLTFVGALLRLRLMHLSLRIVAALPPIYHL